MLFPIAIFILPVMFAVILAPRSWAAGSSSAAGPSPAGQSSSAEEGVDEQRQRYTEHLQVDGLLVGRSC